MKVLVDSHCYLWAKMDDPRLSRKARSILRSDEHELFFSMTSLWEISINIRLGRLRTLTSTVAYIHDSLLEEGFAILPFRYEDIITLEQLPQLPDHRDPFDRMMIAQAINHHLVLLTNDAKVKLYPHLKTIW